MQILAFVRTCKYLGRPANKKLKVGTFLVGRAGYRNQTIFLWPQTNLTAIHVLHTEHMSVTSINYHKMKILIKYHFCSGGEEIRHSDVYLLKYSLCIIASCEANLFIIHYIV